MPLRLGLAAFLAIILAVGGLVAFAGKASSQSGGGNGQNGTTLITDKTAEGLWVRQREYDWNVDKSVTPASIEVKQGQSKPINYTIKASRHLASETDLYGAKGQVCVTNGGDVATQGLQIVDQVQYKNSGGSYVDLPGASLTITPPAQLHAGESKCYPYEVLFTPVPGATYRNTATVTITNHSGYLGQPFGPTPKADFSIPSTFTVVELDKQATLQDTLGVPPGFTATTAQSFPVSLTGDAELHFTVSIANQSVPCGKQATLTNTATVVESNTGETSQDGVQTAITTGVCPPPTPTPTPTATPLPPSEGDLCGCTPGYWKNHTGSWQVYAPSTKVVPVFPNAALHVQPSDTLLKALDYEGGNNTAGAAKILLRAATAALLNATHQSLDYPYTAQQVLSQVNAVLASGNRSTILSLATTLDQANNLGCPLN